MFSSIYLFVILFSPGYVCGVSVEIDGIIDLGPKWNYKYDIRTNKRFIPKMKNQLPATDIVRLRNNISNINLNNSIVNDNQTNNLHVDEHYTIVLNKNKSRITSSPEKVTKYEEYFKVNDIFQKSQRIKDDSEINEFIKHIFKQSLAIFNSLKKKMNDNKMKKQIDFLSTNYEVKFHDFVKVTQKQNIKTKLGKQKVILNTIDISNRILKRLVNYLTGTIVSRDALRNKMAATNVIRNEIEKGIQMEYAHACVKFDVCHNTNNFHDFLINFFSIIQSTDDRKIKQASDALTEVIKNIELDSSIMNNKTKIGLIKGIEYIERSDIIVQRAMFAILKNILKNRNMPFIVESKNSGRSLNRTVAFLNLIDILYKVIPGDEANSLEWNDIRNSMQEWSAGTRDDILDIMQTFVNYLKRGVDKLDGQSARDVGICFDTILENYGQYY